ncbi:MAG: hypothetical protein C4288_10965 [Leptolyngbya sp. ERB_1_1]
MVSAIAEIVHTIAHAFESVLQADMWKEIVYLTFSIKNATFLPKDVAFAPQNIARSKLNVTTR